MANGEGGVFERVIALLQWRVEGEKEAVDSTKKVEAAAKGVGKVFTDAQQRMINFGKALKAGNATLSEMVTEFKAGGNSVEDMQIALQELGYSAEEVNRELGITTKTTAETTSGFQKLGDAVKFAVFRFFTALIVYQALRKILRAINETIQESIRLWKEFTRAQQTLTANLEINTRLIGDQVGTFEEWNKWIEEAGNAWGVTQKRMMDAANAVLQANTTLRLSADELKDIIELGRAAAIQWSLYTEGQLDVAKGVDLVVRAIRGEESAMLKLGVTQEDVARSLEMTVDQFKLLPETVQEAERHAFIMSERYEALSKAAKESLTSMDRDMATLATTSEETSTKMGAALSGLENIFKPVAVILKQALLALGDAVQYLVERLLPLHAAITQLSPRLQELGKWANDLLVAWGLVAPIADDLTDEFEELSEATEESGEAARGAAKNWLYYQRVLGNMLTFTERARAVVKGVVDDIRDAIQPFRDLGAAIGDAMRDAARATEDAERNFMRRMADLGQNLERDRMRLLRRFEGRREELILRAGQRIDKLRRDAAKEEEDDRADMLLRLKHMEEDYLLDIKQLRERFSMDIEEAARKRDWRAIRTLQRRFGLQKKQRGDDYKLQRKQFIESWEQRHKQRKDDLEDEIKDIEDNLAEQLEALERAKQRELEELRIRAEERRADLERQYAQEQEDLARANERRLADILTAAQQEGTIRIGEAMRVTEALAVLYGVDAQNLENMITHDIQWLGAWADAWDVALARIAQARGHIGRMHDPTRGGDIGFIAPGGFPSFAKGGTAIATRPTLVKVGEAGPELFTAIPLAKGGSVLGGIRNSMSGDFNLNIDGNQSGLWSADFEGNVEGIIKDIFKEAWEDA